jgi:hypothetical protein
MKNKGKKEDTLQDEDQERPVSRNFFGQDDPEDSDYDLHLPDQFKKAIQH